MRPPNFGVQSVTVENRGPTCSVTLLDGRWLSEKGLRHRLGGSGGSGPNAPNHASRPRRPRVSSSVFAANSPLLAVIHVQQFVGYLIDSCGFCYITLLHIPQSMLNVRLATGYRCSSIHIDRWSVPLLPPPFKPDSSHFAQSPPACRWNRANPGDCG